jgi:hypothetical protein
MRFSTLNNPIIQNIVIPLLTVVLTFFLTYFFYFRPQVQLLTSQFEAQQQSLIAQQRSLEAQQESLTAQQQSLIAQQQSLTAQQKGQEMDVVWAGLQLLQQRVDAKYSYDPYDPAFIDIENYAIAAWEAIAEGDTKEAKSLTGKAFKLLRTVGGPPTVSGGSGACIEGGVCVGGEVCEDDYWWEW